MERPGKVIRARREALAMSQEQLAWLAGVSRTTIRNIEADRVEEARTWIDVETALGWKPGGLEAIRSGRDPEPYLPEEALRILSLGLIRGKEYEELKVALYKKTAETAEDEYTPPEFFNEHLLDSYRSALRHLDPPTLPGPLGLWREYERAEKMSGISYLGIFWTLALMHIRQNITPNEWLELRFMLITAGIPDSAVADSQLPPGIEAEELARKVAVVPRGLLANTEAGRMGIIRTASRYLLPTNPEVGVVVLLQHNPAVEPMLDAEDLRIYLEIADYARTTLERKTRELKKEKEG